MNANTRLENYICEIESHIPKYETKTPSVSNSTVGWQLDHSLKVINGIIGQLKNAPADKKAKLTLLGRFCLTTRYIPRGKGKAPKQVLPPEVIKLEQLEEQLSQAKELVPQIKNINKKVTFKHPYFGILTKKQTTKFIEIHTKHHLKIINDILNVRHGS